MKNPAFTIEKGLEVQAANLAFWKKILKASAYKKLVIEIEKAQKRIKITDGYDIVRGSTIDCIIANELR